MECSSGEGRFDLTSVCIEFFLVYCSRTRPLNIWWSGQLPVELSWYSCYRLSYSLFPLPSFPLSLQLVACVHWQSSLIRDLSPSHWLNLLNKQDSDGLGQTGEHEGADQNGMFPGLAAGLEPRFELASGCVDHQHSDICLEKGERRQRKI